MNISTLELQIMIQEDLPNHEYDLASKDQDIVDFFNDIFEKNEIALNRLHEFRKLLNMKIKLYPTLYTIVSAHINARNT